MQTAALTVFPPVLDSKALMAYLKRSKASLSRDDAAGRIPRGFRIGRAKRWLKSEIDEWLQAGAPDRRTWEAMRKAGR
jgi:predicted DNA-binding transcriptional regulator AlpA